MATLSAHIHHQIATSSLDTSFHDQPDWFLFWASLRQSRETTVNFET